MNRKKLLSLFLTLALLLSFALPAAAADNTGMEIRLLKVEGSVTVTSSTGKTHETRENMHLYNGYCVSTAAESYAWITLDESKAVKLDSSSSLEVRRSGKELELLLRSGNLFFNVTAPLKEEEKLNIRTSTIVTGVRGTSGEVQRVSETQTNVIIFDGQVVCCVTDPVSGESRQVEIRAGEGMALSVDSDPSAEQHTDARPILLENADSIPGYIQTELAGDETLKEKVQAETGLDLTEVTPESAAEKQTEDQNEAALLQKQAEEATAGIEKRVNTDPVFEATAPAASAAPWTPSGPDTPDDPGTPDGPNDPDDPSQPAAETYAIHLTAEPETMAGLVYCAVNGKAATEAAEGDLVTVTAGAAEGYTVGGSFGTPQDAKEIQFTQNAGGDWVYVFTMPGNEIYVWADYLSSVPSGDAHAIQVIEPVNGTLHVWNSESQDITSAAAGETVTIWAEPDENYVPKSISAIREGNVGVTLDSQESRPQIYTFVMPDVPVTLSAVFGRSQAHTISVNTSYPDYVSWSVNGTQDLCAEPGETVEFTIRPVSDTVRYGGGRVFYTLGGTNDQQENLQVDGEDENHVVTAHFTMPDADAEVQIDYQILRQLSLNVVGAELGTVTVDGQSMDNNSKALARQENAMLRIVAAAGSSAKLQSIEVVTATGSSVTVTDGYFMMPGEDCIATVTFARTYSLTLPTSGKGSVTAEVNDEPVTAACEGDVVSLSASWNTQYTLRAFTVLDEGRKEIAADFDPTGDVTVDSVRTRIYTFVMPAEAVTVEADFGRQGAHGISVNSTYADKVTWKVTGTDDLEAAAGETVVVTVAPASDVLRFSGGEVSYNGGQSTVPLTVTGTDENNVTTASFTMPDAEAVINIRYTAFYALTVNVVKPEAGLVTLKVDGVEASFDKAVSIPQGAEVQLLAEAGSNGRLVSITAKDGSNGTVTVTDGVFSMPGSDCTATVTFIASNTITLPDENVMGSAFASVGNDDVEAAFPGDTVTITAIWDTAYTLEKLIVQNEFEEEIDLTCDMTQDVVEGNTHRRFFTFEMPDEAVVVIADFREYNIGIPVDANGNGTVTVYDSNKQPISSAAGGSTVSVTAEAQKQGYVLTQWKGTYTEDGTEKTLTIPMPAPSATPTFTMPNADVTISYTFEGQASTLAVQQFSDIDGLTVTVSDNSGTLTSTGTDAQYEDYLLYSTRYDRTVTLTVTVPQDLEVVAVNLRSTPQGEIIGTATWNENDGTWSFTMPMTTTYVEIKLPI